MEPVQPAERVEALDVLRGFALFGILVANWRGFGWPAEFYPAPYAVLKWAPDKTAQMFIDIFFGNKFITLFSFLFGVGFAIQLERAAAKGQSFSSLYLRRAGALLLFGIAHGFLLWWGDILATYAVAGILLLLFYRAPQRVVLNLSIVLFLAPFLYMAAKTVMAVSGASAPRPRTPVDEVVARAAWAYLQGSWFDLQRQLVHDWKVNNDGVAFLVADCLAKFLFGLFAWRTGFLRRLGEETRWLRRICLWGLLVGAAGSAGCWVLLREHRAALNAAPPVLFAVLLARFVSAPLLSAGYAAAAFLFAQSSAWPWLRRGLSAAGRMALSNYLLQSVIGTAIHYGYGLGMYGRIGALAGLGLSSAIFTVQLPLSVWWLNRSRFGPVEWLWRSLTYLRRQPVHTAAIRT